MPYCHLDLLKWEMEILGLIFPSRSASKTRYGHRLPKSGNDGIMLCSESGWRYKEVEPGVLRCLDWSEDEPLP